MAVGLVGLLPGSLFAPKTSFAAPKETLDEVLKRVTKENLHSELNAADITDEEKLAIATVKEIKKEEVLEAVELIRNKEMACSSGNVCGSSCGGSCGCTCGSSCSAPVDALSIVDKGGKLKINIDRVNKSRYVEAVEKALKSAR